MCLVLASALIHSLFKPGESFVLGTDRTTLLVEGGYSTHQFAQGVCGGKCEGVVSTL